MALVLADRVRQSTSTTGTGTITLSGSLSGFQTFSVIGDGNTTYYTLTDVGSGDWEVGVGTYTASGTTLSRDAVLASSNGNALVDFGAGSKDVFVTYPAGKAVYEAVDGSVTVPAALTAGGLVTGDNFNNTDVFYYNARTISVDKTIAGTENAMSVGPIIIADTITVTIADGGEWVIV